MVWRQGLKVPYEKTWTLMLAIMTHHQRVEVFLGNSEKRTVYDFNCNNVSRWSASVIVCRWKTFQQVQWGRFFPPYTIISKTEREDIAGRCFIQLEFSAFDTKLFYKERDILSDLLSSVSALFQKLRINLSTHLSAFYFDRKEQWWDPKKCPSEHHVDFLSKDTNYIQSGTTQLPCGKF